MNNHKSAYDCNGTRTHDHLVRKQTLNHLAKLAVTAHITISHKNTYSHKSAYFNFKMKFTQSPDNEYLLECSICS